MPRQLFIDALYVDALYPSKRIFAATLRCSI